MSINLKPHSKERGSSYCVLNFGSRENLYDFLCRKFQCKTRIFLHPKVQQTPHFSVELHSRTF